MHVHDCAVGEGEILALDHAPGAESRNAGKNRSVTLSLCRARLPLDHETGLTACTQGPRGPDFPILRDDGRLEPLIGS